MSLTNPTWPPEDQGLAVEEIGGGAESIAPPDRYGDRTLTGNFTLRWSDNRGPWSNDRVVTLGQNNLRFIEHKFSRCGIYVTRQYELVISDATPGVTVYLEEDVEELNAYPANS